MALASQAFDPSVWPRGPWNELHEAAKAGSQERAVALLADGSIDIDQGNLKGYTPLMVATANGHAQIVRILLNKGANTSVVADKGLTALHVAAKFDPGVGVTKMLVTAGADTEAISATFETPLHAAAGDGHWEVARVLIDAGANPDIRLANGETPLYSAAKNGHAAAVRELLRANADPLLTRTEDSGITHVPLDVAAGRGYSELVRELVQHAGIEGCGGASAGVDALAWAAQEQHVEVMSILADAGVVDTGLALYNAASWGGVMSVKFLLHQQWEWLTAGDRASYVNATKSCGCLPPVYGSIAHCRSFSPKVVRLLVGAGLDPTSTVKITGMKIKGVKDSFVAQSALTFTDGFLRYKKMMPNGEDATEEQLHTWQAIRRLLMRVEAVHAVSWLWINHALCVARTTVEGTSRATASPSLTLMLPLVERRAGARRVLLRSLFRFSSKP